MPGGLRKKNTGPAFAVEDVSRKPQQGRSKASLERMLAAGRELMLERGSEEFTLQEVSERGQVSIGSIYLRFESKDNLVRGVIARSRGAECPVEPNDGQTVLADLVTSGAVVAPRRTEAARPAQAIPVWSGVRLDRALKELRG